MNNSQKNRIFKVIACILAIVVIASVIILVRKEEVKRSEEQKTEQAENKYNPYISEQNGSVSDNSATAGSSVVYDDQNNSDYKDARKLLYYVEHQSSFNCEVFKIDENKKVTSTYDKYGYNFDEKSVNMYIKQITETLSIYGKNTTSAPTFNNLVTKPGVLMKTVFFDSNHNNTVTLYTYVVNSANYDEKKNTNSITVLTDGERYITCDDYGTNANYVSMADGIITNFSDSLDIASPADHGNDN